MANNKNDKRILDLKKQIEDKKKELTQAGTRFSPITNCSLPMDGMMVNIHTMTRDTLLLSIGNVQAKIDGLSKVLPDEVLYIGQYKADEWVADLKQKYISLNISEEKQKLSKLEEKLRVLLSSEKRVELELDSIERLI